MPIEIPGQPATTNPVRRAHPALPGRFSFRPITRHLPPLRPLTFRGVLLWLCIAIAAAWLFFVFLLIALRFIDPPTTAVQAERRLQSWFHNTPGAPPYQKHYTFVPLDQISLDLQHAVIAAEDARFYQHHGFDWHAMEIAAEGDLEGNRIRGGSTLTQQLVKNFFFGTGRSILRKAAEFTLVPVAELVLGKRRILELYLNVVEWGPGIYGAESAAHTYDGAPARHLNREQSARLAAILPAPLKRRPSRMNSYSAIILERMRQMNW